MSRTERSRQVGGWGAWLLLALPLVSLGQDSVAWSRGGSGCTALDSVPLRYDVVFEVDIQPALDLSFDSGGCRNCHIDSSSGGLSLRFDVVRDNLLGAAQTGQPSAQNPSLLRVRPGRPQDSLLFEKLNCDMPPVGNRMPPGSSGKNTALQAAVHDWIALGAIMAGGDRVFYGNMETLR